MRAFVSIAGPPTSPGPTGHPVAAPPHLTLAFLGEVPDERSDALVASVRGAVAACAPFEMALGGYDAFPDARRPRVVFVAVREGAGPVAALADLTRRALERDGFAFDARPFVPHLTVLRIRGASDRERAQSLLSSGAEAPAVPVRVEEVLVNASRLERAGAIHTVIGRCPLGSPAP